MVSKQKKLVKATVSDVFNEAGNMTVISVVHAGAVKCVW